MKNRYLFGGHIEIEYNSLIFLMKSFLSPSKVRDRYASDIEQVIHYNDEMLDIYVSEYFDKGFLCDVELKGSLEEAQNFINTFTNKLEEKNISYQFEWNEVDENDKQIGEEFELKSTSD